MPAKAKAPKKAQPPTPSSGFNKFKKLLKELVARQADLPKSAEDSRSGKDKQDSWYMELIHSYFPGDECTAFGRCLILLSGKYIKTKEELLEVKDDLTILSRLAYKEKKA